jgi:hypothetical protein
MDSLNELKKNSLKIINMIKKTKKWNSTFLDDIRYPILKIRKMMCAYSYTNYKPFKKKKNG